MYRVLMSKYWKYMQNNSLLPNWMCGEVDMGTSVHPEQWPSWSRVGTQHPQQGAGLCVLRHLVWNKEKEATKKALLVVLGSPRKLVEITLKWSSVILSPQFGRNWHDKSQLVESIWWKFVDPLDLLDRNVRIGSYGRKIPSSNPWATTQSGCQGKNYGGPLESGIYRWIYHDTNLIYLFMWFWYAYILWLYICARTYIFVFTHKDWSFPYDIAWHTT